jgi:SOS-response transcriptional repressor LexA
MTATLATKRMSSSRKGLRAMTPVRAATLRFLVEYFDRTGYAPTLREMAAHFSKSVIAVYERLAALEELGLIRVVKQLARGIRITEAGRAALPQSQVAAPARKCPHCGGAL